MIKVRERERLFLHRKIKLAFYALSIGVPILLMVIANDGMWLGFLRGFFKIWLFLLIAIFTTKFPLYILTDDDFYFFTTKKIFNKFYLGKISYERMFRAVRWGPVLFLALKPKGAIPVMFISGIDRDVIVDFVKEKNPDLIEERMS